MNGSEACPPLKRPANLASYLEMGGGQSSEAVGSTEAKQGTDGQVVPGGWGLTFVQAGGNGVTGPVETGRRRFMGNR